MLSAQVQPSGIQVLAAAASDRGMPDNVDPSLLHGAAGAEGFSSMAGSVAALSAAALCPPSPSFIDVLVVLLLPAAEHVSEPTQIVHSEPLCPPGTHQFGTMHIAKSGDVFQFEQPVTSAVQPADELRR